MVDECGENISTEQLKDYVWKTLKSGKVIWINLLCALFLKLIKQEI